MPATPCAVADTIRTELEAMATAGAQRTPVASSLLAALAADVQHGGAVGKLLIAHPNAEAQILGARALAGVHSLMLLGDAPELSYHVADMLRQRSISSVAQEQLWKLAQRVILNNSAAISEALYRPVQQHDPGRAGVLLRGLGLIGAARIRLLEIGACAGLNLALDQYHWVGPGWEWGTPGSPARLQAHGPFPGYVEFVERRGCDLQPRDPCDPHDRVILQSYFPPDSTAEIELVGHALDATAKAGIRVEHGSAGNWLREVLAEPPERGVTTVLWHSSMWGYLDPNEQHEIEATLLAAGKRIPLVRIAREPAAWWEEPPTVQTTLYSP